MTAVTVLEPEPVAPPDGEWTIQWDDDPPEPLDVGDFINVNFDDLGSDLLVLYHCHRDDAVVFGGGAAPRITVRRVK